jgi:MFS family permease
MLDHVGLMVTAAGFAAIVMTESLAEWHLYAFSFLTGIAWSINNPIRQALIANSVPRESLMNAVALNSMAFNSMRMIGPAIGGSLIALVGPGPNFLIQAIMYVGVLFALIPYRAVYAVARPGAPKQTAFQDLREGISYVVHTPLTLTTIVLTMIPTFTMMAFISTQLPVYTAVVLGDDGGRSLGLLFSAMGLGGFIGTLVIARFSRFERKGMLSLLSVVAAGIMLIALTQAHTLWTAALILAIQQLFFNTVMITNNTILQTTTPDHMRGRVMGVLMIDIGLQPLGGVIAGVIVSATSVAVAWGIGGAAGLVAVAIVALTARSFRRLKL